MKRWQRIRRTVVPFEKEEGITIKRMAKENCSTQTVIIMKGNGRTIRRMGGGSTIISTVPDTRANGKTTSSMATARNTGRTGPSTKGSSTWERNTAKESSFSTTRVCMRETSI